MTTTFETIDRNIFNSSRFSCSRVTQFVVNLTICFIQETCLKKKVSCSKLCRLFWKANDILVSCSVSIEHRLFLNAHISGYYMHTYTHMDLQQSCNKHCIFFTRSIKLQMYRSCTQYQWESKMFMEGNLFLILQRSQDCCNVRKLK